MKNKSISRLSKASLGGGILFASSVFQVFALLLKLVLGLIVSITSAINQKTPKSALPKTKSREQELEDFFMAKNNYNFDPKIDPKLNLARIRFEKEVSAIRDQEREKRRKFNRIDGAWKLISVGTGLFIGGATINTLNVGAIGLGILSGALIGWIGAVINNFIVKQSENANYTTVPKREAVSAPTIASNDLPQSRNELVQKVLLEAATNLQKIDDTIVGLKHPDSINIVTQIVNTGKRIMGKVADDPDKFNIAQRVFTYYFKEAVAVATSLAKMENDTKPDVARVLSTQSVLQKLVLLFESTELELKDDDNKALDIDLKLLDQSLKADLKINN
jgi:5-bromo-4-chloroindolyl phosphate hydrolysis protein